MSGLQSVHGTATVTLDAAMDRRGGTAGSQPVYVSDDLLAATAAVLRAAQDDRADAVQALVQR